jgi:hypothetical protein
MSGFKNVLLVFSRQQTVLRDEIEDQSLGDLIDAEGRKVIVHSARDRADAHDKAKLLDVHFVIVGHALAQDGKSPVKEDGGIALSEELRRQGFMAPILLLVPHATPLTNDLLARCHAAGVTHYSTGADVFGLIQKQVKLYELPRRTLDILLRRQSDGAWDYELLGVNFQYHKTGPLQLDSDFLDLLLNISESIGKDESSGWYKSFHQIGKSLRTRLCSDTKFGKELREAIQLAGSIENARISVSWSSIDRTHYPVALEALFPPEEYPECPWMVKAPLSRNIKAGYSFAKPLFGNWDAPLRMLLVSASTHGMVKDVTTMDGRLLQLKPLKKAERECLGLQRHLARHTRDHTLQQLEYVGNSAEGRLSRLRLFDKLESCNWSIVHFAGHSFAKEDGNKESRGYLFVGGPDEPEAIDIEEIAPLLRNTTMVYLSSCDSTSAAFAFELARHGVPIVICFRWKVDDTFAALHAHLFYRYLFAERGVEKAFLQTRKSIHQRYSNVDRAWASSTLLFGASR